MLFLVLFCYVCCVMDVNKTGPAAAAIVLAPPRTGLATPRTNQLSAAIAQLSAGGALHPPFPLLSAAGVSSSTSAPLIPLPSRSIATTQRPVATSSTTLSVTQSQR